MGRTEIGDQHHARALVEGEHGRGTTAGGSTASGFVDELVREQRVEALSDRGARKSGATNEVSASYSFSVAD